VHLHTTTHATLLAKLHVGADPAAWAEFCDRYSELIRAFARRQGLQAADCDEVLQDVLLALTQSMPGFEYDPARGKFRSYLKTVVLHAVYRRFCQKRGAVNLEDIEAAVRTATGDVAVEEAWETEWRQYHLRLALKAVSAEFNDADRAAFEAYAIRGDAADEVAAANGLSVDQVYQAKSRILRRLSKVIEQQVAEEG
jgi:RNA polymerase sigma-70 factor (ECF subfamily)